MLDRIVALSDVSKPGDVESSESRQKIRSSQYSACQQQPWQRLLSGAFIVP